MGRFQDSGSKGSPCTSTYITAETQPRKTRSVNVFQTGSPFAEEKAFFKENERKIF